MKQFRAIFSILSILVIRSGYAKKDHISILAVIQKIWDLHKFGLQIWIQNVKITLWKNFGQFFRFHQFWSSGPRMQKKGQFSILAVFQNICDLHKFGLQIWIQNAKITLWKNFGQNFPISSILVIRSWNAKKDHFSILAVFQNVWYLHKFWLQIWIQNARNTLWKNFGQFFRFHQFWSFLNISCTSKYMGFTYIWVADLNSERKNYSMKEFRVIFPISSILVIRSGYAKKRTFLNISCNSKYIGLT